MRKWLIVGIGGSMGARRCRNLQTLGYTDIVGYDSNVESAKSAAEKYSIQYVESLKDLCEHKFDAAVISVPPLKKQNYITHCNLEGIPCFAEADVTEYAGSYFPSCSLIYHPAIQRIKELLDGGVIGNTYTFTYHMGQSLYDWHPGCDMKTYYAAQKDSGACREMFCFEMSWLSYLFGTPTDAKGLIDKKLNDPDIMADDVYAASVEFCNKKQAVWVEPINENKTMFKALNSNTITGTVLIEILSRPAIRELRIVGKKGTLKWNWDNNYVLFEPSERHGLNIKQTLNGIKFSFDKGEAADGYNKNICEDMYISEMKNFINSITPCCGDCEYINPKENHPITTGHMCTRFNHRLMHGKYHPDFCKLNECKQYLFSREDEEAVMEMLRKVEGK
jgi:predicted dehydrogenase